MTQEFTHQNPHWETDWLADREKAYEEKRLTSSGAGRKNSKKCKDRSDKKRRSSLSKVGNLDLIFHLQNLRCWSNVSRTYFICPKVTICTFLFLY